MKQKLAKIFSRILTIVIAIQAVICFCLLFKTTKGGDMAILGYRFYYIVSPSMEPTIGTGAEIVVKETDPSDLKVDDIITFTSRDPEIVGHPNTHRIVEIIEDEEGGRSFITKGDNNPTEDPYPVYPEEIHGKVVAISPTLEGLIHFYSFAATPMGFVVVVIMPLMLVFGMFFRTFIDEMKEAVEAERAIHDAAETAAGVHDQGQPVQPVDTGTASMTQAGIPAASQTGAAQAVAPTGTVQAGIPIQMDLNQLQLIINALVANYMKEHPGEPITPEAAASLAAALMVIIRNMQGNE